MQCGHFKKANEWLESRYGEKGPIDWSLTGEPVGVPASRMGKTEVEEAQKVEPVVLKGDTVEDDEFDKDEEEAMLQATLEAEQLFSSQGAPKTGEAGEAKTNGAVEGDGAKEDASVEEVKGGGKDGEKVNGVEKNGAE